jgi:predicted dehydrogenase
MAQALPIAIAGAGLMGRWHARYARRCGAALVGIVDCADDAANQMAAGFPGALAFTRLDDLLRERRPQVLHVCTPTESHAPIAEAALAAGVHVLVEKPLAADAEISRKLLSLAEGHGLLLAPTHQFLFQRGFVRARQAASALGRILHVDAVFCSAGGQSAVPARLDEIAAEILPHPLALIERFIPGSLEAAQWAVIRPVAGEWRVVGRGDGVSVSILVSLHGRPTESSFRVIAEGGVIELDLFHGFSTVDTAAVSKETKVTRPFRTAVDRFGGATTNLTRRLLTREFAYPGLRALISAFYTAVRSGGPAPIDPKETLAVASARDAVLQSAELELRRGFR